MRTIMTCIPFLAALGLSLSGCAEAPRAPDVSPAFYRTLDSREARIDPAAARDMISIYRAGKGLPTLTLDPELSRAAQAQAQALATSGAAQSNPKTSLKAELAAAHMSRSTAVGNVSAGYHTLAEAFSGWRQSPQHDAVMLNPKARRMGIATAYAPESKYKVFWALVLTD
jgi:uncharacterized protein YkwD